jgi:predicted nucleic acid-binding protein
MLTRFEPRSRLLVRVFVDTSIVVGAVIANLPDTKLQARKVIAQAPTAISHVLAESFSVLTRMPGGSRLASADAWAYLDRVFPQEPFSLPGAEYRDCLSAMAAANVAGGRIYDGLIAASVKAARGRLVTLDQRALPTYQLFDIEIELLNG